ncbi:hypothetical protein Peur_041861 [Populus x canadensis]|uniref:Thioredoxin domain-containing protein n=1 Tax=Populus deltoides TaxID=3696 RepID=A0A8T2Y477_POPDE|nr:hypothetical protein H0E87_015246 [Populus deltoides]KAH8499933.1 hypothetical protein H0E87_015246 [Populus deltoides]
MEFGWPVLRRGRTVRTSFFNFDHSNGVPCTKPAAGVVDVHSVDAWRSYFEANKQNNKLLVIEFTATWCGPCRHMEQTMKDFAAKYTDVVFIRIDVDELQHVAQQFNVTTMPAFSLLKKGKIVDEVAGVKKSELENKIEKHGMI